MTKIYLIRHCETVGNALNLVQGVIDLDVSEFGKQQLPALTKRFKDVHVDKIITSPLKRTVLTAEAIKGNKNTPIIVNSKIIELDCGVYEGKPFAEVVKDEPLFVDVWNNHPWDMVSVGGESMMHAYERVYGAVTEIVKENTHKTIVLSTHGVVIRLLLCRLLKGDIKKMHEIPYGTNTAVSLLEFDDDLNAKVKYYNDDSHLTCELKNPSASIPSKL